MAKITQRNAGRPALRRNMGAREMIATKYGDNDPLSEVESHPEYMRLIAFQNRELMRLVSSQVQDRIRLAVEIRKEMGT